MSEKRYAVCVCGKAYSDCELSELGKHLSKNPTHSWGTLTQEQYVNNVVRLGRIPA